MIPEDSGQGLSGSPGGSVVRTFQVRTMGTSGPQTDQKYEPGVLSDGTGHNAAVNFGGPVHQTLSPGSPALTPFSPVHDPTGKSREIPVAHFTHTLLRRPAFA